MQGCPTHFLAGPKRWPSNCTKGHFPLKLFLRSNFGVKSTFHHKIFLKNPTNYFKGTFFKFGLILLSSQRSFVARVSYGIWFFVLKRSSRRDKSNRTCKKYFGTILLSTIKLELESSQFHTSWLVSFGL